VGVPIYAELGFHRGIRASARSRLHSQFVGSPKQKTTRDRCQMPRCLKKIMLKNFYTYQMAVSFYKECNAMHFQGALNDQLKRASLSIVLNVAEGSAKPTPKDRKKFYAIALGSYRECTSLLHITDHTQIIEKYDKLGACLYRLSHPKNRPDCS
jgi:four helix bundle protein